MLEVARVVPGLEQQQLVAESRGTVRARRQVGARPPQVAELEVQRGAVEEQAARVDRFGVGEAGHAEVQRVQRGGGVAEPQVEEATLAVDGHLHRTGVRSRAQCAASSRAAWLAATSALSSKSLMTSPRRARART